MSCRTGVLRGRRAFARLFTSFGVALPLVGMWVGGGFPSGAKAPFFQDGFMARLKPCPSERMKRESSVLLNPRLRIETWGTRFCAAASEMQVLLLRCAPLRMTRVVVMRFIPTNGRRNGEASKKVREHPLSA
jgi:hypothetical protein